MDLDGIPACSREIGLGNPHLIFNSSFHSEIVSDDAHRFLSASQLQPTYRHAQQLYA